MVPVLYTCSYDYHDNEASSSSAIVHTEVILCEQSDSATKIACCEIFCRRSV